MLNFSATTERPRQSEACPLIHRTSSPSEKIIESSRIYLFHLFVWTFRIVHFVHNFIHCSRLTVLGNRNRSIDRNLFYLAAEQPLNSFQSFQCAFLSHIQQMLNSRLERCLHSDVNPSSRDFRRDEIVVPCPVYYYRRESKV